MSRGARARRPAPRSPTRPTPPSADSALDILRGAPDEASVLIFVGHNPTASSLALLLDDGDPDPTALRALSGGLPTSGAAVFEVDVPWRDLDVGSGRLVACYPS